MGSHSSFKSRANRGGKYLDALHAVRGSTRLRAMRSNSSYAEVESDDEIYSNLESSSPGIDATEKPLGERRSLRIRSISNQDDDFVSDPIPENFILTSDKKRVRTNEKATSDDIPKNESVQFGRYSMRLRTSRNASQEHDGKDDEDDDGGEEEDDEEDDNEDVVEAQEVDIDGHHEGAGPKYSFRNREKSRRETLNIQTLGGDGGSYTRGRAGRELRDREPRFYGDAQPRLYLGGKIPNHGMSSHRGSHSEKSRSRHSLRSEHRSRHGHHTSNYSNERRHFDSSSDSSNSNGSRRSDRGMYGISKRRRNFSSGDEDAQFGSYEKRRLQEERDSIQPMNMGGASSALGHAPGMGLGTGMGGSLHDRASHRDLMRADAGPVAVDPGLGFQSVGGLDKHVRALKEMIVLPLLYPDVFTRFDTQPPRGVLFVGPPGTGKTLTAR